jgi:hypothetical protein
VKRRFVAWQGDDLDLSEATIMSQGRLQRPGDKKMLRNIFRRRASELVAENENTPGWFSNPAGNVDISKVRALATGAALATAVDSSPAVLVSIYDYAHRYRDKGRRTA